MLSQANLDQHRVPDDIVPTLLEAYASQVQAAESKRADAGTFRILATGTFSRKQFGMVPTDHWIDTM